MNLLVGIIGVAVLSGVWVLVQLLVKRRDPDFRDAEDVLACRMCLADGTCTCGLKALLERSKAGVKAPRPGRTARLSKTGVENG